MVSYQTFTYKTIWKLLCYDDVIIYRNNNNNNNNNDDFNMLTRGTRSKGVTEVSRDMK